MRKDFKKLLCECYRIDDWPNTYYEKSEKGKVKKRQKHEKGDYDEWSHPKREAMSMGRGSKRFGENLKPLERFLRGRVGQKWDDVYSEIREVCKPNSTIGAHIYQHIWDYVEINPVFIDGEVYTNPEWWFGRPRKLVDDGRDSTFYIDEKGFIRKAPRIENHKTRRRKQQEEKRKNSDVRVLDGVYYVRKNDIWYETKLVPLPKPYKKTELHRSKWLGQYYVERWYYPYFEDKFIGIPFGIPSPASFLGSIKQEEAQKCINTYGKKVYCNQLRQLNSRELKKLGLKE